MTDRGRKIVEQIKERYETVKIRRGERIYEFFVFKKNYFLISEVVGLGGFVIEYAENKRDAVDGILEDGDIFPFTLTDEDIINEMIAEIESL